MNHIYTPVNAEVRDPGVCETRNKDYDTQRLVTDGSALLALVERLERFAEEKCVLTGQEDEEGVKISYYEQSLAEKVGKTSDTIMYTDVELTMGVIPLDACDSSEACEKEYRFSVTQSDVDGETLTQDNYILEVNFDGTAALGLRKGSEGIAEALRHDDPLFVEARQWHAATPYDAANFAAELERLQGLKLEESGEVV